jgi:cell division protein FtsB
MFFRKRQPAPQPVSPQQPVVTISAVLRLLEAQNERLLNMSASLDALKADVASLGTEVAQAVALIQANATVVANAAADEAEITALEAQVTSLRDQLAAALAPAPTPAPVAPTARFVSRVGNEDCRGTRSPAFVTP